MPDGVDLDNILHLPGGVVDLGRLPVPRSVHITRLIHCKIDVARMIEDGKVIGYQIYIFDPADNHQYEYPMDDSLRLQLIESLMKLGEPYEEAEVTEFPGKGEEGEVLQ